MFSTSKKCPKNFVTLQRKDPCDTLSESAGKHQHPLGNVTPLISSQNQSPPATTIILENGTVMGTVNDVVYLDDSATVIGDSAAIVPEIVISCANSVGSLNQRYSGSQQSMNTGGEDAEAESTALLDAPSDANSPADEFERFVLNRTSSNSNILESSIYSEIQFRPAAVGGVGVQCPGARVTAVMQPHPASVGIVDNLNSSICSQDSRQSKRARHQHKGKSKYGHVTAGQHGAEATMAAPYPPQYTALFLDGRHHHGGTANAMGQLANAAASVPFLNASVAHDGNFLHQQYQFYQQRPMLAHQLRSVLDTPAIQSGGVAVSAAPDGSTACTTAAMTSPAVASGRPFAARFRKCLARPSLPFVIGILALGGVACTLGGIVLGSTGLVEHSTQYLSAALLMIGIGVSLLVISGAIWRLSLPDDLEECPCYRHMENYRNCNSPYCNRLFGGNYLCPEFQHRPPPPSYLTSLNECGAMGYLLQPTAQPQHPYSGVRLNTPPPLYRSTNSLSIFPSPPNMSSQASSIAPIALGPPGAFLSDPAAAQTVSKEIQYFELD